MSDKNIKFEYVSLESPDDDIEKLDNKDDHIGEKFIFDITYPLENSVEFKLENNEGLTLGQVIKAISNEYHRIYKEEEETSELKTESISDRTKGACMLINRAETNGKYGIWGHGIGDLVMHTLYFKEIDNDGYVHYDLGIDS